MTTNEQNKTANPPSTPPKGAGTRFLEFMQNMNEMARLSSMHPVMVLERLIGAQTRLGFGDGIANIAEGIATIGTLSTSKGEEAGDSVKAFMDRLRSGVDGQYEFRMARGWKMPEGIRYNGLLPNDPNYKGPKVGDEIKDTWVIFHRNRSGSVEALDKSDPRFAEIVGPYVAAQAGVALTIGTKGLTGIKSAVGAAGNLPAKAAVATNLAIGSGDMWGGMTQLGHTLGHKLYLEPEAISRFARFMNTPQSLQPREMLGELNVLLDRYAQKDGRRTAQYFIPPLTDAGKAYSVLDEMSKGQVKAYARTGPFSDISPTAKAENVTITNLREELRNNPHFKHSFYSLAHKMLQGNKLSDSELIALRFGMNVILSQKTLSLDSVFSQKDAHQTTLQALREALTEPVLAVKIRKDIEKDSSLSPESVTESVERVLLSWAEKGKKALEPNGVLADLAKARMTTAASEIKAEEAKKGQQVRASSSTMAFAMDLEP